METNTSSEVLESGDEKGESNQQVYKDNVCFIHSSRLLETVDGNPRYTGRVSPMVDSLY